MLPEEHHLPAADRQEKHDLPTADQQESGLPVPAPLHPAQPATQPKVFWSYIDLVWLIGVSLAGAVAANVIAVPFVAIWPALTKSGPFLLAFQFFLYAVIYLGFFFVFRIRHNRPVLASLGWCKSSFGVAAALATGILLAVVVQAIALLLKTPEKSPIEQFTNTPFSLFLVSIMAVGFAPLFEELLFRGFLQPILTRDLGALAGIGITGCLFGALHAPEYGYVWQYGLSIAVVGITLGYIRQRSGSVIPGTVVHACFNSISVFALLASKFSIHS